VIIRKATEEDIEALYEIERECFTPSWTEGQLLHEVYSDKVYFVVAQDDTGLLGFALLFRLEGYEAEMYRMAVRGGARRRGVASELWDNVRKRAKKERVKKIFLEVRASNAAALALYEKHGFARVGLRKRYYDEPVEDAVIMRLDL
jgi:ribosomal-protein-alanine N-acetyltransferase